MNRRLTLVLKLARSEQSPWTRHGGIRPKARSRIFAKLRGANTDENYPAMSEKYESAPDGYQYLTVKEVAARFRVCRRTIEREVAAKRFPQPVPVGRALRFPTSAIIAFEAKFREGPDDQERK